MTQTVSEQLSAVFRRAARPDGMLDVRQDHSTTRVRDQSTVITLAESTADRLARVLRKTDEQKLETFSSVRNNRVGYEQSRPSQRTFLERLV